jgi:carbon-monoxide dehydrogenase medium subunit
VRAEAAELELGGVSAGSVDDALLARVGEAAAEAVDPMEDLNGSAEYKRQLVRVLAARCVREAVGSQR